MVRVLSVFLLHMLAVFSLHSYAVTSQQMAAFKKLPPSQQAALAKQMGINLNDLKSNTASVTNNAQTDYQSQIKSTDEELSLITDFDDKFEPLQSDISLYGSEVFNNPESTLLSQTISSVPFDYMLAIGDSLNINLYGKESELYELTINSNGKIIIPGITPLVIAGLTFSQANKVITSAIEREKIGMQVTVAIGQIQPVKVFVAGEVNFPGDYVLPPFSNVIGAVSFAGGVSDIASLRNITIRRGNQVVAIFDLYQLLQKGTTEGNTILRSGDVVFVPSSRKQVTLQGAVKRPAIYELNETESYQDAIAFAGGFAPSAYRKVLRVKQANGEETIFKSLPNHQLSKISPVDGDVIFIDKKSDQATNSVALIGAVSRPGFYQWSEGLTLSKLFSNPGNIFLPISDQNYALIARESVGQLKIFQFEPQNVSVNNFALEAHDKIIVFSRFELEKHEREMLENYALSQDDFESQVSSYEWKNYKKRSFKEYIKPSYLSGQNSGLASQTTRKKAVISIDNPVYVEELFNSKEQNELAFFSRSNLLPKLLKSLTVQNYGAKGAPIAEISGRVKYPGLYPIPLGGKVSDLIKAAGGLIEGAYLEQSELSRQFMEDEYLSIHNIPVNLDRVFSGDESSDILLEGRDHLNVFQIPNWQENISVTLKGEVKLPGKYSIRKGESLDEVIERAGGFSKHADLGAVIFTRESLRLKEQAQIKQLAESMKKELITNNLNSENSILGSSNTSGIDRLIDQLSDIEAVGRLVVDVDAVLSEEISLVLEDKDTLYIPAKKQSVNVIGEVFVSTSHLHQTALNVEDYISLSGGMKDKAASDKVFIIKASGKVVIPQENSWFAVNNHQTDIQPGDTIVVPLDSQYKDNLTLWTQVTQVVYQLGVAVAAIGSL